jgi:hypothetical protein
VWILAPDDTAVRVSRHLRLLFAAFDEQRKVQNRAEEPDDLPELTPAERISTLRDRTASLFAMG